MANETAGSPQSEAANRPPMSTRINSEAVAEARKAGHTDDQILDHVTKLGKLRSEAVKEALDAGHSATDILNHVSGASQDHSALGALERGAANAVRGVGSTYDVLTGNKGTGEGLATQIDSPNYESTPAHEGLGATGRSVLEALPGGIGTLAAARLAAKIPVVGKYVALPAAALAAAAQYFGPNVKERAANQGHVSAAGAAEPTAGDMGAALGTTAAQSALAALPVSRLLPGANRITATGVKGILDSAKKLGTTVAAEGASNAGNSVIGQVGATVGTPGGTRVDPTQALDAGITGGATGGVLASPRFGRDTVNAARFSDVGGPLAIPASAVANRILAKVKSDSDLQSAKKSYSATSDASADVLNELRNARSGLNNLTTEADNALARATAGRPLSQGDLRAIEQSAPSVSDLAAQATVLARLKQKGNYDEQAQRFGGGIASRVYRSVVRHPLLSAGGIAALISSPLLAAKAALAGGAAYGGAKALDKTLGLTSPAASFVEKFSNPRVPVRNGAGSSASVQSPVAAMQALASQAALASKVRQGAAVPVQAPATPPPPTVKATSPSPSAIPLPLPTPTTALVTRISKADGETKEQSRTSNTSQKSAHTADETKSRLVEEVPTPEGLLRTQVSPMDHEIAHTATEQFKAAGNVPPVVASRYYTSTAQRQARIRDRLMAISGDPRFPSDDLQLGQALDKLRHVRSREALAHHIEDVASTVKPEVANVLRAYFGPAWAKSVWNPAR